MSTQPQSPTSSKIDISLTDDDIIHLDERCYQNIPTIVREQPVDRRPPPVFTRRVGRPGVRVARGFNSPQLISDEMADFLNVPHGHMMARPAVGREIHCYVEKHNLQNPHNGREIIPDNTLARLLNYSYEGDDPNQKLSFFNLQKHMTHHFTRV